MDFLKNLMDFLNTFMDSLNNFMNSLNNFMENEDHTGRWHAWATRIARSTLLGGGPVGSVIRCSSQLLHIARKRRRGR